MSSVSVISSSQLQSAYFLEPKAPPIKDHEESSISKFAERVSISQEGHKLASRQAKPAQGANSSAEAVFDTVQGPKGLNIEEHFSPENGMADSFSSLEEVAASLILPTKSNIDALADYINAKMPQFLAENGIPSAPSSVTYDFEGKIQLPEDYQYAEQFREALENDPTMENVLRTTNALTSHYVGMQKAMESQQPNTGFDQISLLFNEDGNLMITANGEELS